jgi:hypothetical protein
MNNTDKRNDDSETEFNSIDQSISNDKPLIPSLENYSQE